MENQEPAKQERAVEEDHHCSICLGIFYQPHRLVKCKHIFCKTCLNDSTLIAQNRRCPLCRTEFAQNQIIEEKELWNDLRSRYPTAISEKKKFIVERVMARFLVGNTTQFLQVNEDNKYRWTLFVRPAQGDKQLSETIQRIDVRLHPTFNPSVVSFPITGNRIVELSRIGWGTFRITIQIFWKNIYRERMSEIFHDLQFSPVIQRVVYTQLTVK